jgi:hypothetical protein
MKRKFLTSPERSRWSLSGDRVARMKPVDTGQEGKPGVPRRSPLGRVPTVRRSRVRPV